MEQVFVGLVAFLETTEQRRECGGGGRCGGSADPPRPHRPATPQASAPQFLNLSVLQPFTPSSFLISRSSLESPIHLCLIWRMFNTEKKQNSITSAFVLVI